VLAQVIRVEMVVVQMRDVEEVTVTERRPVERTVVWKREPRSEVGGVQPWVTQDASGAGVNAKARMPDAGDLHKRPLDIRLTRVPSLAGRVPCAEFHVSAAPTRTSSRWRRFRRARSEHEHEH